MANTETDSESIIRSDTPSYVPSVSSSDHKEKRLLLNRYARRIPQMEDRIREQAAHIVLLDRRIKDLEAQLRYEKSIKQPCPSPPPLPFELWQNIFAMATEFHSFAPARIGETETDRENEWKVSLRLRKAIVGVCQTWKTVGQSLLFEHIVLKKIPQLAGIVRILENSSRNGPFGRWTKTIKIEFAVMSNWHQFYRLHLVRLLQCCPKITAFIDHIVDASAGFASYRSLPEETLLCLWRPPLRLVHLDMSGNDKIPLSIFLSLCPSLTSLNLPTLHLLHVPEDAQIVFRLPHLRELVVWAERFGSPNLVPLFAERFKWIMPSLHSLTIYTFTTPHQALNTPLPGIQALDPILSTLGSQLRSLDLMSSGFWKGINFSFSTVLTCCPRLERIGFDKKCMEAGDMEGIISLSLVEIFLRGILPTESVFYTSEYIDQKMDSIFSILTRDTLPSLKRIWTVDSNEDGIIDPFPLPRRVFRMWKKWIPHWKERGVRFENKHGIPLRFYRTMPWHKDDIPLQEFYDQDSEDDEEDSSSILEYDESYKSGLTSVHGTNSARVTDDASDFAYRYSSRHDVEVPSSDEAEWKEVEDEMEDDIDEETALEIYSRMVEEAN